MTAWLRNLLIIQMASSSISLKRHLLLHWANQILETGFDEQKLKNAVWGGGGYLIGDINLQSSLKTCLAIVLHMLEGLRKIITLLWSKWVDKKGIHPQDLYLIQFCAIHLSISLQIKQITEVMTVVVVVMLVAAVINHSKCRINCCNNSFINVQIWAIICYRREKKECQIERKRNVIWLLAILKTDSLKL